MLYYFFVENEQYWKTEGINSQLAIFITFKAKSHRKESNKKICSRWRREKYWTLVGLADSTGCVWWGQIGDDEGRRCSDVKKLHIQRPYNCDHKSVKDSRNWRHWSHSRGNCFTSKKIARWATSSTISEDKRCLESRASNISISSAK